MINVGSIPLCLGVVPLLCSVSVRITPLLGNVSSHGMMTRHLEITFRDKNLSSRAFLIYICY
jgi:hypothetical protein